MGHSSVKGVYSDITINGSDEVVLFLLYKNKEFSDWGGIQKHRQIEFKNWLYNTHLSSKTMALFQPVCPAIYCEYDDYGGVENIQDSPAIKALEKYFDIPFEDILKLASQNFEDMGSKYHCNLSRDSIKKIKKYNKTKTDIAKNLTFCFELKGIYDELIKAYDPYSSPWVKTSRAKDIKIALEYGNFRKKNFNILKDEELWKMSEAARYEFESYFRSRLIIHQMDRHTNTGGTWSNYQIDYLTEDLINSYIDLETFISYGSLINKCFLPMTAGTQDGEFDEELKFRELCRRETIKKLFRRYEDCSNQEFVKHYGVTMEEIKLYRENYEDYDESKWGIA